MPKYLPDVYEIDEGNEETEEILFEITAELESVYGQAYNEMLRKALEFLAVFRAADAVKRRLFESGKIDKEEYRRWRLTQMLTGRNAYAMADTLATDLTNVNAIAASVINDYMPQVYAVNTNWAEYTIEKTLRIDTSFTLFDEQTVERLVKDNPDLLPRAQVNIPKDQRWNKEHINAAITQGILQGETIDEVAIRLAEVTDMSKNAAVRNAATMTTSAQNGGRIDSYKRAQDMGIAIKKRWIATLDGHTRPSHRLCDGEVRELGKPFPNGLIFPGDPNGTPAEVYNCRCRVTGVVEKQLYSLSDRDTRELERWDISYDEWKETKGQNKQPITRSARNVNRDLKMHEEYRDLLGKRVPSRFKDFQEMKYKQPETWRKMVSDARKARNKRRAA